MVADIKAIEVMGQIDKNGELHLDEALPIQGPSRVRVILLIENSEAIEEQEWLRAASRNPAFEFLKDQVEDIYALSDGIPFND
jgi:hypothetical protein